jgi:hypothetical protein
VRARSSTVIWKRYCSTAAKAGGNRENKLRPIVTGDSCLLENIGFRRRFVLAPVFHIIPSFQL